MATGVVDLYLVYSFLKRLVQPFDKWKAFDLGVIDADGNILIQPKDRTPEQKKSLQLFDVMIMNLKKLLAKIPGGSSRFASFSAAAYLLKEGIAGLDLSEEELMKKLIEYQDFVLEHELMNEDAPTNNWGGGHIADTDLQGIGRPRHLFTRKQENQNNAKVHFKKNPVFSLDPSESDWKKNFLKTIDTPNTFDADAKPKTVRRNIAEHLGWTSPTNRAKGWGKPVNRNGKEKSNDSPVWSTMSDSWNHKLVPSTHPSLAKYPQVVRHKDGKETHIPRHIFNHMMKRYEKLSPLDKKKFEVGVEDKEKLDRHIAKIKSHLREDVSFRGFLVEGQELTQQDLKKVEAYADRLFKLIGVDVDFSKHFIERVNDPRNKKQITVGELATLYQKEFKKYGNQLAKIKPESEAVLKDMSSDINLPVVMKWIKGDLVLRGKTIMRKKDFHAHGPEYKVQ